MARKTLDVTIDAEGRDKGKVFRITEMPAAQAEKWAFRAVLALGSAGVDLPKELADSGVAGLRHVAISLLLKIPFHAADSLLDELFSCVAAVPNSANPSVVRQLVPDDTEEIATRLRLRMEVINLHAGFLLAAA